MAIRASGGISLFVNNKIANGVDIAIKEHDWLIWNKFRKDYFNLDCDLYVACFYLPPVSSTHRVEDPFGIIENDILNFPSESMFLLVGDHNARVGELADFVLAECLDEPFNFPSPCYLDTLCIQAMDAAGRLSRVTPDHYINDYGRRLIELCKTTSTLIFNGRVLGNSGTNFTCQCPSKGNSVVDYFVGSSRLLKLCANLNVLPKFPESDHRPVALSINSSFERATRSRTENQML